MKIYRTMVIALSFLLVAALSAQPPANPKATLDDFAWLAGHWTTDIPAGHVDQYWAKPGADGNFGMFRLSTPEKTLVLEFFTLRPTPEGLEMRVRHFNMDLGLWEKEHPIILKLKSFSKGTAVFENPIDNSPKRSTIRKLSPDSLHVKSEIINADKKTEVIELTLKRVSD
jgi:Domain of unknown function (DUF6265)